MSDKASVCFWSEINDSDSMGSAENDGVQVELSRGSLHVRLAKLFARLRRKDLLICGLTTL